MDTNSCGKKSERDRAWENRQVERFLEQLTLDEKISMIHGAGFFRTAPVERLGIPALKMTDGPMGVRQEFPDDSWRPCGLSDDSVTYLPSNSCLASAWNPELAHQSGKVLGEEVRGRGKDVSLAPGINIKRDPRCGRNFEYLSEDPYLTATMAVPFIRGIQECDVAACVKHFAANSQETDRLQVDTIVDERTLREIYLPAFEAAVKEGGSLSLMNAYNRLNGVHCSENRELLNRILREEWKYDGCVISDWGSVHTTLNAAESALDLEMSVTANFDEYFFAAPLREAVERGEIEVAVLDEKVRNILRMMLRLKMIGPEVLSRKAGAYNTREHREIARKIAEEGIVLLKNEKANLPLTPERLAPTPLRPTPTPLRPAPTPLQPATGDVPREECQGARRRRIAVIGRNADWKHSNDGGSAEVKALYEVTPLMGIKTALGGSADVVYAPGYFVPEKKADGDVSWQEVSLEQIVTRVQEEEDRARSEEVREMLARQDALRREACELASGADEVIFVGGLNHFEDSEGHDRSDLKLPYGQDELIEALAEICPNLIVVMVAGAPVEMPWLDRVKSLVWCYYAGMEAGSALADILLGRVNPSGKLAESMPKKCDDLVTFKNGQFGVRGRVEYREGIFYGYRYYEREEIRPAFAFGHGLSYTSFVLENLSVTEADRDDAAVTLRLDVRNTGSMAGAEVVQCYISDPECSAERPVKELKGYRKVFLEPGESRTIELALPRGAFAFYDAQRHRFTVEPGRFQLLVGSASDNCPLQADIRL